MLAADVLDGAVSAQPGEHDLELLLSREPAVVALGCQLDLPSGRAALLRAASDALGAPPGLLRRPSDLREGGINAGVGSRQLDP